VRLNFHDVNPGGQLALEQVRNDRRARSVYSLRQAGQGPQRTGPDTRRLRQPVFTRAARPDRGHSGHDVPTIELEPTSVVEGIVVDKAGTPVADAEIRVRSLDMADPSFIGNALLSDAAGRFAIKELARTETACASADQDGRRRTGEYHGGRSADSHSSGRRRNNLVHTPWDRGGRRRQTTPRCGRSRS